MKTARRKTSAAERFRRTPWGFYLLLAVVAWACIIVGLFMGLVYANRAEATAPVVTQPLQMVEITEEAVPEVPEVPEEPVEIPAAYTEEQLEILALIIYREAGGDACSDETRQMVGEVFLNRVESDLYPDTFAEVATQRAQYGRLHWTGLVWPDRAALPQEAHAVERAYEAAEALLDGAVERLLPEDAIFQAEFPQGTETLAEQDGLYFCR